VGRASFHVLGIIVGARGVNHLYTSNVLNYVLSWGTEELYYWRMSNDLPYFFPEAQKKQKKPVTNSAIFLLFQTVLVSPPYFIPEAQKKQKEPVTNSAILLLLQTVLVSPPVFRRYFTRYFTAAHIVFSTLHFTYYCEVIGQGGPESGTGDDEGRDSEPTSRCMEVTYWKQISLIINSNNMAKPAGLRPDACLQPKP